MRKVFVSLTLLWLSMQPAMAESEGDISGFIITSISGINVTLSEQFGTDLGDETHQINLFDCYAYLQLTAPDVCEEGITLGTDVSGDTDSDAGSTADTADTTGTTDTTDTTDTAVADAGPTDTVVDDVPPEPSDTVPSGDASSETVDATNDNLPAEKPGGGKADESSGPASFKVTMSTDSFTDAEFGVAVGTSCGTTEFPTSDSGSCVPIVGLGPRSDFTDIEFDVLMTDLLGDDCLVASTHNVYVYINDLAAGQMYVSQVAFDADYTVPEPPTISDVLTGETNLTVSWNDDANSNEASITYTLYYSEDSFTSVELADNDPAITSTSGLTVTEYQLTGLTNYTEYHVGVIAEDSFGNQSEICNASDLGVGIPVEVDDFFEHYKKSGGQEEGGMTDCFVATAAWGSQSAGAVLELRALRDKWLLSNEGGKALVSLYYDQGPEAALVLANHDWMRPLARLLLIPSVVFSIVTRTGMGWILLAGLLLWWAFRRRKRSSIVLGGTR